MKRLLVMGIVMAMALTGCNHPPKQAGTTRSPQRKFAIAPAPGVPIPQVGRYVVVHNPQFGHETMLLDTATGKTWRLAEFTNLKGSPMGWEDVPRLDTLRDWENFVASRRKVERGDDRRSAFLPEQP